MRRERERGGRVQVAERRGRKEVMGGREVIRRGREKRKHVEEMEVTPLMETGPNLIYRL